MHRVPCSLGVVPQGVEFLDVAPLLLDPCVVLEVVDALAVGIAQLDEAVGLECEHVQVVVKLCRLLGVFAVHLMEFVDAALVHHGAVGEDGTEDVVFAQLVVLRHLDTAQDVGDAADTEVAEGFDKVAVESEGVDQVGLARLGVEQPQQSLAVLVVDSDRHVGVLDVVDPRDVLVADALDAVTAEAVVEDGGTLERFADAELQVRILLLEVVARAHRAGGA